MRQPDRENGSSPHILLVLQPSHYEEQVESVLLLVLQPAEEDQQERGQHPHRVEPLRIGTERKAEGHLGAAADAAVGPAAAAGWLEEVQDPEAPRSSRTTALLPGRPRALAPLHRQSRGK